MSYCYLDDYQIRSLFLNKYIKSPKFNTGAKVNNKYHSFKFYKNLETLSLNNGEQVLFLPMFEEAHINTQNDISIFNRNYDIPIGFLKLNSSYKPSLDLNKSKEAESSVDSLFLGLRRGLIYSFNMMYQMNSTSLKSWFSYLEQQYVLPPIVLNVVSLLTEHNGFPQVPVTAQFAKNTKLELQFIFLGRLLGELCFQENGGKLDDEHKDWFKKLNPDKEIIVQPLPEGFKLDAEFVFSYILALILNQRKDEIKPSEIVANMNAWKGFTPETYNVDTILFFTSFLLGVLKTNLNNTFHTSISSPLLLSIDKKALEWSSNLALTTDKILNDEKVKEWLKYQSEKIKPTNKRFKLYCQMLAGVKPTEATKSDVIAKIQPFNIASKTTLVGFFRHKSAACDLFEIIKRLPAIKHVLLVYKLEATQLDKMKDLDLDLTLGSYKKSFSIELSHISFEIISSNIDDIDDRDTVNNLSGFINKYSTETNFLYISNPQSIQEKEQEELWLGKAFSKTPIFDPQENYLFIS